MKCLSKSQWKAQDANLKLVSIYLNLQPLTGNAKHATNNILPHPGHPLSLQKMILR